MTHSGLYIPGGLDARGEYAREHEPPTEHYSASSVIVRPATFSRLPANRRYQPFVIFTSPSYAVRYLGSCSVIELSIVTLAIR